MPARQSNRAFVFLQFFKVAHLEKVHTCLLPFWLGANAATDCSRGANFAAERETGVPTGQELCAGLIAQPTLAWNATWQVTLVVLALPSTPMRLHAWRAKLVALFTAL